MSLPSGTTRWSSASSRARVVLHDDRHPAVLQHLERRPVRALEHLGRDHVLRRPSRDHLLVQADELGRCAAMPFRSCVVSTIAIPRGGARAIRCITSWRVRTSTPARRLVQQEELRPTEHRARDEHPLLLPARELPDVAVAQVPDPEPIEDHRQPRTSSLRGPGHDPPIDPRHQHGFADGDREVPVHGLDLRDVADRSRGSRTIRPAIGRTDPAIARSSVRLPAAARSDDADEVALGDGQVDVDQHRLMAVRQVTLSNRTSVTHHR